VITSIRRDSDFLNPGISNFRKSDMFSIQKSLILRTALWIVFLIIGYFSAKSDIPEWTILLPVTPLVVFAIRRMIRKYPNHHDKQ
jgi:hypothetical protein